MAPPKVENKLVTTVCVIPISRNAGGTVPIVETTASYAFSGNGYYKFGYGATTPTYQGTAQQPQLDLAFEEYKYWTPVRVKITWYPFSYQYDPSNINGNTVKDRPTYIVDDLDLGIGVLVDAYAAKGMKAFHHHAPLQTFSHAYDGLDKLALQKQQKMMFLTNGSWANREQLRSPACIQFRCNDPIERSTNTQVIFGQIVYELQIRMSDRVDPQAPQVNVSTPRGKPVKATDNASAKASVNTDQSYVAVNSVYD